MCTLWLHNKSLFNPILLFIAVIVVVAFYYCIILLNIGQCTLGLLENYFLGCYKDFEFRAQIGESKFPKPFT